MILKVKYCWRTFEIIYMTDIVILFLFLDFFMLKILEVNSTDIFNLIRLKTVWTKTRANLIKRHTELFSCYLFLCCQCIILPLKEISIIWMTLHKPKFFEKIIFRVLQSLFEKKKRLIDFKEGSDFIYNISELLLFHFIFFYCCLNHFGSIQLFKRLITYIYHRPVLLLKKTKYLLQPWYFHLEYFATKNLNR